MNQELIFSTDPFVHRDMVGWRCIKPSEDHSRIFRPALQDAIAPQEGFILGYSMVERSTQRFAGLRHAEAMFREKEKIPPDWLKRCLVFPEIWQRPDGRHEVFCLYHRRGRNLAIKCLWLRGRFFDSNFCFVNVSSI